MKKFSFLFVALMACSLVANAQFSNHSAGIVVGSFEGVSYKGFFTENWALQVDLGYKVVGTGAGTYSYSEKGEGYSYKGSGSTEENMKLWTLELNPNAIYQDAITELSFGSLSWFAGAGVSIGFGKWGYSGYPYGPEISGKFGINAIGGVELGLNAVPITIGIDFRPGYGLGFDSEKEDGWKYSETLSYFDWALAVSARYCF